MLKFKTAVHGLADELSRVDTNLAQFISPDSSDRTVCDIIAAVLGAKGKKIRPTMLLLSSRIGSKKTDTDRLCKLGALVEMVHMASLIHDDIVDDSPLRRGNPTVQSQFGKDMAVYTGDFLLSRVMYHLFAEGFSEAGMILGKTIEKMCKGEIGQFACRYDSQTTLDNYLNNICGKTVALFAAACKLGALEGGLGEKDAGKIERIGEHLGYMFQMRDDLLDFISSEDQEGKPVCKDFCDGIYTMPVLYALGTEMYGSSLRKIAKESKLNGITIGQTEKMRGIVIRAGGIDFTQKQIENHAIQAERLLLSLPQNEASGAIWQLINWLGEQINARAKSAS